MAEKELARASGEFVAICQSPCVCKTPSEDKPVPYQITADLTDSVRVSANVNFSGAKAVHMDSRVTKVTGNEAGSSGGVGSEVNTGHVRPTSYCETVIVNGNNALYHVDTYVDMNCAGPEGTANTTGKIYYSDKSGQSNSGAAGLSGADPPVDAETAAEANYLENFGKELTSPEGIVKLAQQAPQMAEMDWSNPTAVLGAVGSVAGVGGLENAAKASQLAGQAYQLSKADWSDPSTALAAIGAAASAASVAGNKFNMDGLSKAASYGTQASNLAGQGYRLSQADWSDPATALSALGTAAGAAGMASQGLNSTQLAQLAQVASTASSLGNTALQIVNTDWNNPGEVLGAASSLAGMGRLAGGDQNEGMAAIQRALSQNAAIQQRVNGG